MSFLTRASQPSIFPSYLLPSLPFRRRKSSNTSEDLSISSASPEVVDIPFTASGYLAGHGSYLRCGQCCSDLCLTTAIVSRGFTGRWGRAYLVSAASGFDGSSNTPLTTQSTSLPNTHIHKAVARQLVTGAHTVSDVSCALCGNVLGWKYETCPESQEYKAGKFILETKKVSVTTCWEQRDYEVKGMSDEILNSGSVKMEPIEFDSQDEDECEDLFAGVWTPALASKRRRARKFGRE